MNQNETRTLWISVGAALFAVFLLYSYTQEKSAELQKKFGAKQRVVVVTKDINEMETVDETMLSVEEKPVDFIEPGAFSDPEPAVGMIALAPIKQGEQLLQSKVIKPGPITGLSLQVSPSKRALAIPISEQNAVAKLIKPGDRIDIIAALDVGKGVAQHREVKTLLQDVIVLSTGMRIVNDIPASLEKNGKEGWSVIPLAGDMSFTTINIEASPEESQDLIYILSTSPGSLFITLRHPSDHNKKRFPESTIDSLLGKVSQEMLNIRAPANLPPPPPPAPVPPPKKKSGPFVPL